MLDDLIRRGLRRPEFLIPAFAGIDRAAGLDKAIAAVWHGVTLQRCTVHKHRNLLAHAPERLHEEITPDYTDMIYATSHKEIEARRKAFLRKWRLKHRAVADSLEEAGERLFAFTRLPPSQWKSARTTTGKGIADCDAVDALVEAWTTGLTVAECVSALSALNWARLANRKGHYQGQIPKFETISEENLTALPRDAFEDQELLSLVRLPLFTGCQGSAPMWQQGTYFLQNHIYWAFLILILTGMRPGEVGRIRCRDVVTDGEFYFFDLRPFDARTGRVALKDLRRLKTSSSGRVVPIHPLLIDLGLLDRLRELEALDVEMMFPEWEPYRKKTGELRWGQPITKSWQYVKKLLEITRADLTLYGTRHWLAELLDSGAVAQRTRNRILGHVNSIPDGYGRKGMLSPEQSAAIAKLEPPVIKEMRTVLIEAKERSVGGQLTVLKPWLSAVPVKKRQA